MASMHGRLILWLLHDNDAVPVDTKVYVVGNPESENAEYNPTSR